LPECYEALCQRNTGLEDSEAEKLGIATTNRIWKAREAVQAEAREAEAREAASRCYPKRSQPFISIPNNDVCYLKPQPFESIPNDDECYLKSEPITKPPEPPTEWDHSRYAASTVTRIVKEIFEPQPLPSTLVLVPNVLKSPRGPCPIPSASCGPLFSPRPPMACDSTPQIPTFASATDPVPVTVDSTLATLLTEKKQSAKEKKLKLKRRLLEENSKAAKAMEENLKAAKAMEETKAECSATEAW
jgi:hypothetical protein